MKQMPTPVTMTAAVTFDHGGPEMTEVSTRWLPRFVGAVGISRIMLKLGVKPNLQHFGVLEGNLGCDQVLQYPAG